MNPLSFHYKNNVDCNDNYLGEYADLCFLKCSLTAFGSWTLGDLNCVGLGNGRKTKQIHKNIIWDYTCTISGAQENKTYDYEEQL